MWNIELWIWSKVELAKIRLGPFWFGWYSIDLLQKYHNSGKGGDAGEQR